MLNSACALRMDIWPFSRLLLFQTIGKDCLAHMLLAFVSVYL